MARLTRAAIGGPIVLRLRDFFAVGTRVTSRPPHRNVRAAFPHAAPTSGINGSVLPYAGQHLLSRLPGSKSGACLVGLHSFGPCPSLHQLRSGSLRFVRRLHSYYGGVTLLVPVHHRRRLLTFPMRHACENRGRRWVESSPVLDLYLQHDRLIEPARRAPRQRNRSSPGKDIDEGRGATASIGEAAGGARDGDRD